MRRKYKRLYALLVVLLMVLTFVPTTSMAADEFVADSGVYDLIGGSTNDHSQAQYLWKNGSFIYVAISTAFQQEHNLYNLTINGVTVTDTEWLAEGVNLKVYDESNTLILDEVPDGKANAKYYWLVGKVAIPVSDIVVNMTAPGGFELLNVSYKVQGALNVYHEYPPAGPVQDIGQSVASNHIGGLAPGGYSVSPVEKTGFEYSGVTITVGGDELISIDSGEIDSNSFNEGTIGVNANGNVTINLNESCAKIINVKYIYELKDFILTINYEFTDGSEAYTSYIETKKFGDTYSVNSPVIAGYTADRAIVAGTMPAADVTETVVYTATDFTLTINYEFADGSEAATSYTATKNVGDTYSVNSPAIAGYTADRVVVAGTMPAADVTETVVYTAIDYDLSLNVVPTGGGTASGSGTFNYGDTAPISAVANTGYAFVNWTEGETVVSTSATHDYIMPARDVTLTANFMLIDYALTLNVVPTVGGSATGGGTYKYGDVASLNATANTGYAFVDWTNEAGTVVSVAAAFNYTMPARDVTLTANFEQEIIIDPSPPGSDDDEPLPVTGGGIFFLLQLVLAALLMGVGFFLVVRFRKVNKN
jgi:uncharacterized repeat protein (TIGR02543 family)